jgi:glycosyltransferase involved in cell wall biosynthesis
MADHNQRLAHSVIVNLARRYAHFAKKLEVDKVKGSVTSSLRSASVLVQSSVMTQVTLTIRPLVSVVTPFYNTARYLAQCIESVLTQSYTEFEYILMDNCSTDGSAEIAESYARRDPRIRIIRCSEFVPQLQNYNRALAEISDASQYCKLVQADDYIFPECLELMVQAFAQSKSIGLVSSYWLHGDVIAGSGYPYPTPMLPGKECGRWSLRTGRYVFGSQTTVMYRSSLVRQWNPFYNESLPHADLEKCMEILTCRDFGFVHQVLSFARVDDESITASITRFAPYALDRYIITQRYASAFLEPREASFLRRKSRREYYRVLAKAAIQLREPAYWRYHQVGLKVLKETINCPYLLLQVGLTSLWLALNPGMTAIAAVRSWKRRRKSSVAAAAVCSSKRRRGEQR